MPIALGALPLLFSDEDQIKNYVLLVFLPWASVFCLFAFLYATLREAGLCLMVLAAPFLALTLLGTLIAAVVRAITIDRDKRRLAGAALMILPFAFVSFEQHRLVREEEVSVPSSIVVDAPVDEVFEELAVIEPISRDEYPSGILNSLGVPRPIEATVDRRGVGGHRIGKFEGGLEFQELITTYAPPKNMTFDISVDPRQLDPKSTGRHALEGGYFRFVDATYTVEPVGKETSRVTLTSRYVAKSSVNSYGEVWADFIIGDFQSRVLEVLRRRFGERHREKVRREVAASP